MVLAPGSGLGEKGFMLGIACIDLGGEWMFHDRMDGEIFPAVVPGCVHNDLLNAGKIPDPYHRDNEGRVAWVGERTWTCERTFQVDEDLLGDDSCPVLVAEGLDTLASIEINGQPVGYTDNMFRRWEFAVAGALHPGTNCIRITFHPVLDRIREKQSEKYYAHGGMEKERIPGSCWIRKEQCNFGWDWGPILVTCGIWRPIRVEFRRGGRILAAHLRQVWNPDGSVTLHPDVAVENCPDGEILCELAGPAGMNAGEWGFKVKTPQPLTLQDPLCWWPNGMGGQPLYSVRFQLLNADGNCIDSCSYRIGLRQLELVQETDQWGCSFKFRVNNRDFFAKGANWIPADCFDCRVSDADLEDLLNSAAGANMNMIRVWGGGLYERDRFYDLCDQLGLFVWQDFMFACAAYPFSDAAFKASVQAEAEEAILRLRRHPSLACWCGNNEIEQMEQLIGDQPGAMSRDEYRGAFVTLLGGLVKGLDPERPYIPSSAHTPAGFELPAWDPDHGDLHLWAVWHGGKPFSHYLESYPRFCSEFGFQSFPEPATIASFAEPEDCSVESPVMVYHQRSGIGNRTILKYMKNHFRVPGRFDDFIWVSQILQAEAMRIAVEHYRRNSPRCMGALYWQLNDTWPGPSWSSIDHAHRWKALHYVARRFFAPVLLSAVLADDGCRVDVHITCDPGRGIAGELVWTLQSCAGETLAGNRIPVLVREGVNLHVDPGVFSEAVPNRAADAVVLALKLISHGECVATCLLPFVEYKYLALEDPQLEYCWRKLDTGIFELTLTAHRPSPWVWISCRGANIRCSDNFIPLMAGESRAIQVQLADRTEDLCGFPSGMTIHNLYATLQSKQE